MTRRIIVDTDIGTDVDDALALAFALHHTGIDVVTVTTVSGDTGLRARIACGGSKYIRFAQAASHSYS